MNNVTIWHNPKCSKSRDVITLLAENNIEANVIKYLDVPTTKEELAFIIKMLGITPRELLRKSEELYKILKLSEERNEEKIIEVMVENPRLIERPIVIKNNKAVIGRPIENVMDLLGI